MKVASAVADSVMEYDATVTVGFKQIDNRITEGWSTKDDESVVADLARELDIEIIFTSYLRICTK